MNEFRKLITLSLLVIVTSLLFLINWIGIIVLLGFTLMGEHLIVYGRFDFFDFFNKDGSKIDKFDIIGYIAFGIPTNLDTNVGDEFETEFESNLSLMYHANENLQLLLELDRSAVINGDEAGTIVMNISPGIKFNPFNNPNIFFGISAGIPVTNTELFDSRIIGSVFYHFD
ncbi:MAG: hypothetical protein IIB83_09705 [Bacteroidetes bacterium]|nr:hypothetical protein [Bacteroidota bacterium]